MCLPPPPQLWQTDYNTICLFTDQRCPDGCFAAFSFARHCLATMKLVVSVENGGWTSVIMTKMHWFFFCLFFTFVRKIFIWVNLSQGRLLDLLNFIVSRQMLLIAIKLEDDKYLEAKDGGQESVFCCDCFLFCFVFLFWMYAEWSLLLSAHICLIIADVFSSKVLLPFFKFIYFTPMPDFRNALIYFQNKYFYSLIWN